MSKPNILQHGMVTNFFGDLITTAAITHTHIALNAITTYILRCLKNKVVLH